MKSLYKTLEVPENASDAEIKKSYRRLARKYHPDINKDKNAEEKFKEINAAYEVLSDPDKKARYDSLGDSMFGGQNFSDFARGGVNIDEMMRDIFGDNAFGGFGHFGGFRGDFRSAQSTLSLPLKTAILGGTQKVNFENQSFEVRIPAGIREGEVIRIGGKNRGGDLLLKIKILDDDEYKLQGDNLSKSLNIALKTALFGGSVGVKTLYKDLTLKIPPNTKNNQQFRIKEQGAKNRKTQQFGDLYLKVNIVLPKIEDLDSDLKAALDKLPEIT